MKSRTYFLAYKRAMDKKAFFLVQQGGDYSKRIARANRLTAKLESKMLNCILPKRDELLEALEWSTSELERLANGGEVVDETHEIVELLQGTLNELS